MPRLALILIATALAGCTTMQPVQYAEANCPPDVSPEVCREVRPDQVEVSTLFGDWLTAPEPYPFSSLTNHSIMRALGY